MKLNEVKDEGLYYDLDDIYYTPENIYEVKKEDNKFLINKWHYDYSDDEKNDFYILETQFDANENDPYPDSYYNVDLLPTLSQDIRQNNLIIKLENS